MSNEVIVADAHAVAMIAALRSLGRAGYKVHAASPSPNALGFKSSFAYRTSVNPEYASAAFVPWLRDYVATRPIRGIVCGESFMHAIRNDYAEFEHLFPDPVSNETRQLCLSKARVWSLLASDPLTSDALPKSGIFDSVESIESFTGTDPNRPVYYLKPDREYAHAGCDSPKVVRVNAMDNVREAAHACLSGYSSLFAQEHVPGQQVGVSLWRRNGKFIAENMVLGLHMYPYRWGSMSLRKTWWHEKLLDDAKRKTEALSWTGACMLEYKWDPDTDQFWFIELNPRFWGYLHLDLSAGRDFPRWQMDAHVDNKIKGALGPVPTDRTMRYAPGEVIHLASRLVARDLRWGDKVKSFIEYFVLGINPTVGEDMWFPGDRLMYFRSWMRFLRELPTKVFRNLRNSTYAGPGP